MQRYLTLLITFTAVGCGQSSNTLAVASAAVRGIQDDTLVVARRLSARPDGMRLPDGDYIRVALLEDGNHELVRTDMNGVLRRKLATGGELGTWPELQTVSPDGSMMSYLYRSHHGGCPDHGCREIRIVATDGSMGETLLKTDVYRAIYATSWSANNALLAVQLYLPDQSQQLTIFDVRSGTSRIIRSFASWRGPRNAALSPDGKWLAYDEQIAESRSSEIVLIEVNGNRSSRVTSNGTRKEIIGWAADGSGVFYQVTAASSSSLFFAPVQNGKVAGTRATIRKDIPGTVSFGHLTSSGLGYTARYDESKHQSVRIDSESGRVLSTPVDYPVTQTYPVFSADASHAAYVYYQPAEAQPHLTIQTIATGSERHIPLLAESASPLRWLPHAQSVEVQMRVRGKAGIYEVNLRDGKATFLRPPPVEAPVSPDGKTEYLIKNDNVGADSSRLVARDISSGTERELFRGYKLLLMGANPNGSNIAVLSAWDGDPARLMVVGTGTPTTVRVLYQSRGRIGNGSVAFSPNGRLIVFKATDDTDTSHAIYLMNLFTGQIEMLHNHNGFSGQSDFSADGMYVTYRVQQSTLAPEHWFLENLPGSPSRAAAKR